MGLQLIDALQTFSHPLPATKTCISESILDAALIAFKENGFNFYYHALLLLKLTLNYFASFLSLLTSSATFATLIPPFLLVALLLLTVEFYLKYQHLNL